jgi:hypothetical protein
MSAGAVTSQADSPAKASRRRVLARTRLDFWLDLLLLVAYTLAYSLGFTGIAIHERLGIGLGMVLLVVAVIVGLEQVRAGVTSVRSDDGLDLADTGNLIRTCEIEAALAVVVITVSAVRRRHRRMRRTAVSTAPARR